MLRFLALSLLLAVAPEAQTLVVESATPADYASGIALQTAVSFTFSEALGDVSQGFGTAPSLVILPADSAEITAMEQSVDMKTITYMVTLQDDRRYVFLVLGARSASGDALVRPFALNLTTGGAGFVTIQGEVSDMSEHSLDGTLVALVTGDFDTGALEIAAVDVIDADAPEVAYAVGPVGLGLYTAGAIRLPLPIDAATTPEALARLAYGFYDTDGDGSPDPVFATSGIDIHIVPPDPTTASETYDDALATASGALHSPLLTAIPATPVTPKGRSAAWRYTFQSETDFSKVDIVQVGPFGFAVENIDDVVAMPLPTPFVDSDQALAVSEGSGGADFRAANSGRLVVVTMDADATTETPEGLWRVAYRARDTADGPDVDGIDVTVPFSISDAEEPASAIGISLRHAGAHPRHHGLSVAVRLATPTRTRLQVLDARGRLVAVLHDGPLAQGETVLGLGAALTPGVYVVHLVTPEARRVLRAVVTR